MKNILVTMLALVALSCGSRKRSMEKTESKLEVAAENKTVLDAVVQNHVVDKSETNVVSATEEKERALDVGPGGEAVIEEFDAAGNLKKKTTLRNNGRSGERDARAATETKTTTERTDKSKTDIRAEAESKVKSTAQDKAKAVAVDRKGGGVFWLWILLAVIGLLLLVAWFRRRKK